MNIRKVLIAIVLSGIVFCGFVTSQLFAANTEEEAYTISVGLYNDGLIDLARDQFENFLTQFPNSTQAPYIQFLIGECDYRQKKYEPAIQQYRKGISDYPGNIYIDQMLYKLGRAYFLSQKYKSAQDTFREYLESYPDGSQIQHAYYWLGETYFKRTKYQEAIETFSAIITKFPSYELLDYTYYSLGWSYLNLQDYDNALKQFRHVRSAFPDSELIPSSNMNIARSLFLAGSYEQANQEYGRITETDLSENAHEAFFWMAESAYYLTDYEQALTSYRRFLDAPVPEEYADNAQYGVAWSLLQLGKTQEAIQHFQHFLTAYPRSELFPASLFQLGSLFLQENRVSEGIQLFEDELNRHPGTEYQNDIRYQLGQVYFQQASYDKALNQFQILLNAPPSNEAHIASAFFMSGACLYAQNNYADAIASYEQAIARAKADATQAQREESQRNALQIIQDATFRIGLSSINIGHYDAAISSFTQLLEGDTHGIDYYDQVYYWLGEAYFNQQDYSRAIDAYQQVLHTFPDSPVSLEAQYGIAWAYYEEQQWGKAAEAFVKVYQAHPTGELAAEALFQAGENYLNLEDYSNAEAFYQRILQEFPSDDLAYKAQLRLGQTYYKSHQLDKAIAILQQPLANMSEDQEISPELLVDTYSFLGLAYSQTQEYDLAIEQFEHALDLTEDPSIQANLLLKIADASYQLGEYDQAQSFYTRLIEEFPTAPEIPDAQYSRILTYLQLEETERYIAASKEFLTTYRDSSQTTPDISPGQTPPETVQISLADNPHIPAVLYQLGEYYVSQQEYNKALPFFQQLVTSYSDHELADESSYGIGWCYLSMKDYSQTIQAFNKMLEYFPQSEYAPDAHYGLATSYFKQQDYSAAITEYTLILEHFPEFSLNDRVLLNLGTAFLQLDETAKAIDVLQQSIDRYPNQPDLPGVYLKLGYALAKQGECQQAIPVLGQAVAGSNVATAAEAQFRIGECSAQLQERDKAIVDYLKVVYLYPGHDYWVSHAQFKAAMMYEEIGKEEDAMTLYQKIIAASQETQLVEKAQQRIKVLTQELPDSSE